MATSGKSSSPKSKKPTSTKSTAKSAASKTTAAKGKADAVMEAVIEGDASTKVTSDKTLILTEDKKAPAPPKAEKSETSKSSGAATLKSAVKKKPLKSEKPEAKKPEPAKESSPPAAAPVEQKSSGFFPMIAGGFVAGALGFGVALIAFPEGVNPNRETARKVAIQEETIAGLQSASAETASALETAVAERTALSEAVDTLSSGVAALAKQVAEAPQGDPTLLSDELAATLAAQKDEIARLQGELEKMATFAQSQIAAAEAEQENAALAEARVKARGALNIVRDALASGGPFADALPDIEAAVDVPDTLANVADSGVASLNDLQATFADGARAALSASVRENAGSGAGDRLRLFLQDQFSARSLTPQEGDDPDAVLSRAEAAVRQGDLSAALTTLEGLPDSGQSALAEWSAAAQTRQAALEGFQSISNALSEN